MIFEDPKILIKDELKQLHEEGYNASDASDSYQTFQIVNGSVDWTDAKHILLSYLNDLPEREDYNYFEPSDIESIVVASNFSDKKKFNFSTPELLDRIHGALLGRAAGCMLGKPLEGLPREKIMEYLEKAGEEKLDDYFPYVEDFDFLVPLTACFRENLVKAVRDDDLDYPLINLKVLENYGFGFTTDNVGKIWLENLPFGLVYTAERAAYRNLVQGIKPPETATFMNPYREWIGAQIRADMFGWVCPGDPAKAAKLAYKDASLSHTKNGIYGEMFIAAALAAAYYCNNAEEVVNEALNYIPAKSRLFEAINFTIELYRSGDPFETAWAKTDKKFKDYAWVHTINNACFVVLGLLYGEGNFGKSICLAVEAGADTDCNGATVGSIMGVLLGANELPEKWISPLNDTLESLVPGFQTIKFSDLSRRVLGMINIEEVL